MPAHKRKYRSGQVVWHYVFDMSGSTREDRLRITGSGFATKREAEDAEANRRIEEQQKRDLAKAGASIAGRVPRTLSTLLEEFFRQHVDEKLAPKTIERYHEQAAYLNLELLNMPIGVITPYTLGASGTGSSRPEGITAGRRNRGPSQPRLSATLLVSYRAPSPGRSSGAC
jgi:hypothetical protein